MVKTTINLIFFGTSPFAEVVLDSLLKSNKFKIKAVVTQPDKPTGRKQVLTPSPVKLLAQKNNLSVLQPTKLDENINQQLKKLNPDIFLVIAYGKFIPDSIINIAPNKFINIHPSLLPKYRGPSPIQSAFLNDDHQTGITLMQIDDKMDHGPIIKQIIYKISPTDTFITLSKKLARASADLLIKTLPLYINNKVKPIKQNHDQATLTKIITKEDGAIKLNHTASQIYNLWRAYQPWPGIFGNFKCNNKNFKIKLLDIKPATLNNKFKPLQLFTQASLLYLTCANNTFLEILKLQPEGKNEMDAKNFINGYLK